MRDFLEDAEKHRDDGYGRAQKHVRGVKPKRFYKETGVAVVDGGFAVTLDGKPTMTPGRKPMVVPVAGIATRLAGEWGAQVTEIDPDTMPMLRLMNAAVEGGDEAVPALRDEVVKYAAGDLMLYRADGPDALVAEQERLWDAALVRLARHFGLSFQPTIGILHQEQPASTLARLREAIEGESHFVLTALVALTGITGSGLLAIGFWHRLFTADEVWAAAHVDEDHQIRIWGEVEEATAHRAERRRDFDAATAALDLLRAE